MNLVLDINIKQRTTCVMVTHVSCAVQLWIATVFILNLFSSSFSLMVVLVHCIVSRGGLTWRVSTHSPLFRLLCGGKGHWLLSGVLCCVPSHLPEKNPHLECYADRVLYVRDGVITEQALNAAQWPLSWEQYEGLSECLRRRLPFFGPRIIRPDFCFQRS
jgi:hypothetical protein